MEQSDHERCPYGMLVLRDRGLAYSATMLAPCLPSFSLIHKEAFSAAIIGHSHELSQILCTQKLGSSGTRHYKQEAYLPLWHWSQSKLEKTLGHWTRLNMNIIFQSDLSKGGSQDSHDSLRLGLHCTLSKLHPQKELRILSCLCLPTTDMEYRHAIEIYDGWTIIELSSTIQEFTTPECQNHLQERWVLLPRFSASAPFSAQPPLPEGSPTGTTCDVLWEKRQAEMLGPLEYMSLSHDQLRSKLTKARAVLEDPTKFTEAFQVLTAVFHPTRSAAHIVFSAVAPQQRKAYLI